MSRTLGNPADGAAKERNTAERNTAMSSLNITGMKIKPHCLKVIEAYNLNCNHFKKSACTVVAKNTI